MTEHVDAVVVGAGVVGLATAAAVARSGRSVVILERHDRIGTETSSRNSEVIHAGLYYERGSLKAECCVRGRQLLYERCAKRGIAHRKTGKVIVATEPGRTMPCWRCISGAWITVPAPSGYWTRRK